MESLLTAISLVSICVFAETTYIGKFPIFYYVAEIWQDRACSVKSIEVRDYTHLDGSGCRFREEKGRFAIDKPVSKMVQNRSNWFV